MQKITLIPNIKQTNKQKYWQQKPINMIHLEQKRTGQQQQEQQIEISSKINQKRVAHFVLPDFIWNRILSRTTHTHANENEKKSRFWLKFICHGFLQFPRLFVFFSLYAPSAHSIHKFVGCCQLWNLYWNVFRVFV